MTKNEPDVHSDGAGELPEIPAVSVSGNFFENVQAIPFSQLALLMATARCEDEAVLLPFVEFKLGKADEEKEPEDIFSSIITFENAAFLLMDLSGDLQQVCKNIGSLSTSKLRPEPVRVEYTKRLILKAQEHLAACLVELDQGNQSSTECDEIA